MSAHPATLEPAPVLVSSGGPEVEVLLRLPRGIRLVRETCSMGTSYVLTSPDGGEMEIEEPLAEDLILAARDLGARGALCYLQERLRPW